MHIDSTLQGECARQKITWKSESLGRVLSDVGAHCSFTLTPNQKHHDGTMAVSISISLLALLHLLLLLLLLTPPSLTHAFSTPVVASGVESTARKRIGKKSFINKERNDKLPPILTPNELHTLGTSLSKRIRGSHSFHKGWLNWRTCAIDAIRSDLSNNLPHPTNRTKFENLFFRLGVASDVGQMPSFEDAGARSAYAIEFFCRARNLADLYIDGHNPNYIFPEFWLDSLMSTPMLGGGSSTAEEPYSTVSLGGGPGFDYVSAALATSFCSYYNTTSSSSSTNKISSHDQTGMIKATILDYEEGWGDLVQTMTNSTQNILQNSNLQCNWGGKCDITQSIFHTNNGPCLELVNSTQLFTCQYCVAENANSLQESNYIFFHDLFKYAQDGTLFVFSEVHPRLWPDFYHLIKDHCTYMSIGFNKNGRQTVLQKRLSRSRVTDDNDYEEQEVMISDKDLRLVKKFEELATYHKRKINSGWIRQVPKRRLQ